MHRNIQYSSAPLMRLFHSTSLPWTQRSESNFETTWPGDSCFKLLLSFLQAQPYQHYVVIFLHSVYRPSQLTTIQ
jgi:hypothetical protein